MGAQTSPLRTPAAGSRSIKHMTLIALLASLAVGFGTMALAGPVFAATIVVNEDADELTTDGDCSLREALEAAANDAVVDACVAGTGDADIITVPAATYQLADALGDLQVSGSVSIVGADRATTIIQGPAADRVFWLSIGDISISNVTITGGNTGGTFDDDDGGGIFIDSEVRLTLTNSTVTDNHATGVGNGGGIFLNGSGSATITGSLISDNTAANDGGGIYSLGNLSLVNSSVSGNSAAVRGGGIASEEDLSLVDVTIDDNQAEEGGGLSIDNVAESPAAAIDRSTISNNRALGEGVGQGGGIWADTDFSMINSTVSGNTATGDAGGIRLWGDLRIDFSTISDNNASANGGGIWVIGSLTLYGTIIANNPTGDDCYNADASLSSLGSNIDSDDSCELDQPSDQFLTDPLLGPLASNGGPTFTHALLAGSPAIDGVAAESICRLPTDQRGVVRPQDGDLDLVLVCDIGAYELVAATGGTPSPGSPSPTSSTLPDTAGDAASTPSSAPWLGFAVLALIGAIALTLGGLRRRYADPSASR